MNSKETLVERWRVATRAAEDGSDTDRTEEVQRFLSDETCWSSRENLAEGQNALEARGAAKRQRCFSSAAADSLRQSGSSNRRDRDRNRNSQNNSKRHKHQQGQPQPKENNSKRHKHQKWQPPQQMQRKVTGPDASTTKDTVESDAANVKVVLMDFIHT